MALWSTELVAVIAHQGPQPGIKRRIRTCRVCRLHELGGISEQAESSLDENPVKMEAVGSVQDNESHGSIWVRLRDPFVSNRSSATIEPHTDAMRECIGRVGLVHNIQSGDNASDISSTLQPSSQARMVLFGIESECRISSFRPRTYRMQDDGDPSRPQNARKF
ncbi:uncharacterized protein LAESUDRAFT_309055 [Laetiporus sulphureus 93-53]|uniref:Uncharacterized protein n=1 Tax=Laetiporus sulphureus 93-53 TaxID=1314785 RepID=A0A165D9Z0_9APHY|nr:uncharacterized protein LAESUDRAFT_309055 [Laetiporus sulphureus 93-53]KZT04408.1 hypothetical protein LAESUDRAFT_309055 [Laetiporus sulphureus 93-53]